MSIISSAEVPSASTNPIDLVEEIVAANEWAHERASDDEMFVEIGGRWCDYRLFFVWQAEMNAMLFSCGFEMKVPRNRRPAIYELLSLINEKLWLGHFDLAGDAAQPSFRHSLLLRGSVGASVEQVEDLVDSALTECERFYPAFQFVVWGGKPPSEALSAAMIDPVGEA
ncbi:MAG: YbjN domain-containing protein [Alphaproteobacteria bacterium]